VGEAIMTGVAAGVATSGMGVALGSGSNVGVGESVCLCPAHALRTRLRPMNKMLYLMRARL